MTAPVTLAGSPKLNAADAVLREVMAARWPSSPEAMAMIGSAKDRLAALLDTHARLAGGIISVREADPDLEVSGPDPDQDALDAFEDQAHEAAVALRRVLAEYRRREAAAGKRGAA